MTLTAIDFSAPAIPGYGIRPGYVARPYPHYFVDEASTVIWQPDVYSTAAAVASTLGGHRIVDVGCGSAQKLMALRHSFSLIGIDYGANIVACRERYPEYDWRQHDLDEESPLPLGDEELDGAVIVASDVIEHLVRPELLVRKLALALARAKAVVISTPERERTRGPDHNGPPPNEAHVREWTLSELATFLQSEGFEHGDLMLTRSNNVENILATSLAVLVPTEEEAVLLRKGSSRSI